MANRNYKPGAMAIEKGLVCLYGRATIGATGAITTQDARGFSIANGATGVYTITLEDNYTALRMVSTNVIDSITAADGKVGMITAEDVANGTLEITFVGTDDGAAADPASGAVILIEITLKNSSVAY